MNVFIEFDMKCWQVLITELAKVNPELSLKLSELPQDKIDKLLQRFTELAREENQPK